MTKMKELLIEVEVQTAEDRKKAATEYLMTVKAKVDQARAIADEAENQYNELLERDAEEIGADIIAMQERGRCCPEWPRELPRALTRLDTV